MARAKIKNENNEWVELTLPPAGDTLPIGSIVEIPDDMDIPYGYELVEEQTGIIKQVKDISIPKGANLDDTDISKANQVILYYKNTSNPYYGSLVFPKTLSGQFVSVYGKDNIIGYFYVQFQIGRITNSPASNEIFEIIGYDIVA